VNADVKPWGRLTTLGLAVVAMIASQIIAVVLLAWWSGRSMTQLSDFGGDGAAVTAIILISTPIQIALIALFAGWRSPNVAEYLGLIVPRRSDVIVGISAIVLLIVVANTISWLLGRDLVTSFQHDIFRTSTTPGAMLLLWIAVVIAAPLGEEIMFRGFLFRGWLKEPRDIWPTIVVTGAMFALLHVQYDWFVIGQVFAFGVLLGFMRWVSGSTLLTILLHAIINFEGMIETWIANG
jgi:membrane protease YdiL (CAAX protease family)